MEIINNYSDVLSWPESKALCRKSESSWTGDYTTGTSATTLKDLKIVMRN